MVTFKKAHETVMKELNGTPVYSCIEYIDKYSFAAADGSSCVHSIYKKDGAYKKENLNGNIGKPIGIKRV